MVNFLLAAIVLGLVDVAMELAGFRKQLRALVELKEDEERER